MTYNTKQKDIILEVIKHKHTDFTIKDILNELNGRIGLTTIYRLVDKLVNEGTICKDSKGNYQYLGKCDKNNHFFIKCENCGKLEHVDCDCITSLWDHIYNEHKFLPTKDQIVINGVCAKCDGKGVKIC
ncbi:MAG: transcriptional repressor [Bacilli bacterium]|nr:transcriptional repressor [Bacilli bacterium]